MNLILKFLILLIGLTTCTVTFSQKTLRGLVKDAHSDEAIAFASITFKGTSMGAITDSLGKFAFSVNDWPSDTLIISYVGYETFFLLWITLKVS
ncbi:carboxypeptidase-like regulatory domain-containing protein [Niabella hibiscisoli]|uniref:carboxypeptidase-like regulatory domain-containing protein n=1 Tax=Niabella hibiscisoli TaxID=1825928 RepID=UPI001F105AE1|nr:carboxypeptidase-like regulatory domain-containing protein [Niabella hibiscisoli]MCH5715375.1 carboxypeptidase-like regulatory domain-containing protein [Niabella hibiscisoli]